MADDSEAGTTQEEPEAGTTQEEPEAETTQEEPDEASEDNVLPQQFTVSMDFTTDTTEIYNEVFAGIDKFGSWEEFIELFEAFQEQSHSVFKPRNATCVSYVNEKRVTHKIAEKFVYQTVNMICQHFGYRGYEEDKTKKPARKRRKSYVGCNCGAYVKVSYKKGFLHVTDKNLVHTNHPLIKSESAMRKIRPVVFNDELDFIVSKIALHNRVFEYKVNDFAWKKSLIQTQKSDDRLVHITMRMMKRRVHFLMERYRSNSEGGEPLPDDEMGVVLHQLINEKEMMLSGFNAGPRLNADGTPMRRKRGRPRKIAANYEEYLVFRARKAKSKEEIGEEDDTEDLSHDVADTPADYSSPVSKPKPNHSASLGSTPVGSNMDLSSLFDYWRERDGDERKLRWQEIELRREEMEIRRKEMELQQQKFEHEKQERIALMDLLKIQGATVARSQGLHPASNHVVKNNNVSRDKIGNITKEFILLKDGTLKPIESFETVTESTEKTESVEPPVTSA